MSSIYSIYKATNTINNKVYIGFTSKWPLRISQHKSHSKNSKTKFHKALIKYGQNSFSWELLYQSKDLQHTMTIMEPYFIAEYNSFGKGGYNLTKGGEGTIGTKHKKETKLMWSKQRTGSRNGMYGKKGILNPNFGKHCHTDDFKSRKSKQMKENNPSKLYRVKCIYCKKEMSKSNHTKWHGDKCNYFLSLSQSSTLIR
jgi:group I intron endonuclease